MHLTDMWEENKIQNNIVQDVCVMAASRWNEIVAIDGTKDKAYTYAELLTRALALSKALFARGVGRGTIVVVKMHNSLELMLLYFAALFGGFVIVPIDPLKGSLEIEAILVQLPEHIIIDGESSHDNRHISWEELFSSMTLSDIFREHVLRSLSAIDIENLFLITFTSGSTGVPKGVRHSFQNLALSALAFSQEFNFNSSHIFYHNLPMTYMAGILNLIFLPFLSGSKIIIGERFGVQNILHFWTLPIRYGANVFWFIPTVLSLLLTVDRGSEGIEYAKNVSIIGCVGTAPLPSALKTRFEARYGISLYESYGLSETLFVSTNSPKVAEHHGVGRILQGVSLEVAEDNEIFVRTPWNYLGYLGIQSDSTPFASGDLGELSQDRLVITGRKKDLIIRGGINISPRTIEEFLMHQGMFHESVVLGFSDPYLGEKIVCFFVPDSLSFSSDSLKKLRQAIPRELGRHYAIDEFVEMNALPKNLNGKIDKLKIRTLYGGL